MASEVEICNLGLQVLAVEAISSLTGVTPQAKACNRVYDLVRKSELRKNAWNFSIKRAILAASTTVPEGTEYAYKFPLPSDFLRLLPGNTVTDWLVEDGCVLSNSSSVEIRYVSDVTDTGKFDSLFVEVFALAIAIKVHEQLNGVLTKKRDIKDEYRLLIREAKKINAFENIEQEAPIDPWLLARL